MNDTPKKVITIEATVKAPVEKVWNCWTSPEHITKWNFASEDWHCPYAENDIRVGGKFKAGMAAKDGSVSFDFEGEYTKLKPQEMLEYKIADGRHVSVYFTALGKETKVTESFEAEDTNSVELQRGGWQAILNNFKKHTESVG